MAEKEFINGLILEYQASHFNGRTEESLIEEGFTRQQLPYIRAELKKLNGDLAESRSTKPRAERLKKAEERHEKAVEAEHNVDMTSPPEEVSE
jgi:hypothetical protein